MDRTPTGCPSIEAGFRTGISAKASIGPKRIGLANDRLARYASLARLGSTGPIITALPNLTLCQYHHSMKGE